LVEKVNGHQQDQVFFYKGGSSGSSQPLVRIEQTAAWICNYSLQVVGYSNFGGIRRNGTGNTIFTTGNGTGNTIFTTGNNDMGLTTNTVVMKFNVNGAERMRITNVNENNQRW
jgi:hypothetical protein